MSDYDIIDIQLKSVPKAEPKYAELERQVAELQAEIERLKKEESNTLAEHKGFRIMKNGAVHVQIMDPNGVAVRNVPTKIMMGLAKQLTT